MFHNDILKDFSRAKKFFENLSAYSISPYLLNRKIEKNDIESFNLVDVRDYEDYINGHIEYAQHIPIDKIEEHLDMLDKSKPTITYCYSQACHRALKACLCLVEHDYPTAFLDGGYKVWKRLGFDVVKNSSND